MTAVGKHASWKGDISFGLVHIPIALHSINQEKLAPPKKTTKTSRKKQGGRSRREAA